MRRKCPICGRFIKSEPSHQPIIIEQLEVSFPFGKRTCPAPVAISSSSPLTMCSKGHTIELPFQDC